MHKRPGTPAHVGRRVLTQQQALALSALRPQDLPHYGKVQKQIRRAIRQPLQRRVRQGTFRVLMGKV